MDVNTFAEEVINDFIHDITDHIFLYIQNDNDLLRKYMALFNDHNLKGVNPQIGKKIKEKLDLDDDGKNNDPKSGLIEDYTYHKLKK